MICDPQLETGRAGEYERVCSLLRQCGCAVYRLSQMRASKQTPGLPDCMAFSPKRGFAMIEVKRPDGKGRQRRAQRELQQLCELHGIRYVLGGVREVIDWLRGAT